MDCFGTALLYFALGSVLTAHFMHFHADPAFQEYLQSEKAEQLIQGVDSTFMRPTDYSAMK
jgi:hypothetical protein